MKYQKLKNFKVDCIENDALLHFQEEDIIFPDLPRSWRGLSFNKVFTIGKQLGTKSLIKDPATIPDYTGIFQVKGYVVCPVCHKITEVCTLQFYLKSDFMKKYKGEDLEEILQGFINKDEVKIIYRFNNNIEKVYFPTISG